MKIVSWNINSLRKRQERLLLWLAQTQPDVVCLQETKCADEQFPGLALRAAGYHSAFHGQKSYNGVAILSKAVPQNVRVSLCDEEEDPQARVIAATIDAVRVYNTALRTFPTLIWAKTLFAGNKPMAVFTASEGSDKPPQVKF